MQSYDILSPDSDKKDGYLTLSSLKHLRFYLVHLIYWYVVFFTARLVFLGWHWEKTAQLSFSDIPGLWIHGSHMDLSAVGYLLVFVVFAGWFREFFQFKAFSLVLKIYYFLLHTAIWTAVAADLEVYQAWGVKLNAEVVYYCQYPAEALASAWSSPVILLTGTGIAFGVFFWRVSFHRIFNPDSYPGWRTFSAWKTIPVYLVLLIIVFLMIRGGTGLTPMNPGFVYFSENSFANHAAINATWNVVYDLNSREESSDKEVSWYPKEIVSAKLDSLYHRNQPSENTRLLSTERPNIVLIILESWTADMVPALGGVTGYTPTLDSVINNGLLFDEFYANGKRSAYGISSLLTGFPSIPDGAIIKFPTKFEKLPSISERLGEVGYTSWFFYGGDVRFDNMNAFLLKSGFSKLVDKSQFRKEDQNSKWGAFDDVVLKRMNQDLKTISKPFFSVIFTLTSHEPFEIPVTSPYPSASVADQYKNSIWYSDLSLGNFLKEAKAEEWYENTLFIFVADHGHRFPLNRTQQFVPERFHIPCVFFGPVLKSEWVGKRISSLSSQSDLAATLLNQLNLSSTDFTWSNDLVKSPRHDFAYFNLNDGFGWMRPGYQVSFDFVSEKVILETVQDGISAEEKGRLLMEGKTYLQGLYRYFNRIEWEGKKKNFQPVIKESMSR